MAQHEKFPYKVYTSFIVILILLGLSDALYLLISHYRNYTDIDYSSFCAISKSINCDTVSQSPWSITMGLPLALWGLFFYIFTAILTFHAIRSEKNGKYIWDILLLIFFIVSIADVYLAYISAYRIHAYCIMCFISYVINFSLFFSIWIIKRRFYEHSIILGIGKGYWAIWNNKKLIILISCFIFFCSIIKLTITKYWIFDYPTPSETVLTGITSAGNPWIGANNPLLTIEEFTDYQCFQCSKIHMMLRMLVNKHPTKLRIVHHHYPMDDKFNPILVKEPFHVGSGKLALLAIAAEQQNKFWSMNDALYSISRQGVPKLEIKKLADKLGLDSDILLSDMYSKKSLNILEQDIRKGLKNNITGTPSFIIDGVMYQGQIPPRVLRRLSDK